MNVQMMSFKRWSVIRGVGLRGVDVGGVGLEGVGLGGLEVKAHSHSEP